MRQYETYKDTGIEWIGKVPSHWELSKLKHNFHIYAGATPKTGEKANWDGDICWITPADYKTKDKYVSRGQRNISQIGYNSCNTQIVPKGSLIVSKRAPIGTVAISSNPLCTNQGCLSCVPLNANVTYYYYCASIATEIFDLFGSGTTFKEISANAFANIKFPCPPLKEQNEIATYLDTYTNKIDIIIKAREKKIQLLEELKTSIITMAVIKGVKKDVETKDSGIAWIGTIPAHWESSIFKRFLREPMKYGANESAESDNRDYPRYIRITDIDSEGNLKDETFKSLPMNKAQDYLLEKGDVLFARSGATVGKTYIHKGDTLACYAGYLIKAKCNNKLLPEYLFLYTQTGAYENWKNSIYIQSTIQNIGADKYSYMPIVVPPINEQEEIVSFVKKRIEIINDNITKAYREIELIKEYRSSLITEVVTGKRKII